MKKQLYEEIVSYIIENQSRFYRLAYSYTGNREAALDVVQNAVCTALEKYRTIRKREYMKTWFYRVLVNESLTYIRDNGREVLYEPLDLEEGSYQELAYEPGLELYKKVELLPENIRVVIVLHYYEEMTLKEIAEITDTNLNTVKSRLYSGLKKLKNYLEEAH